MAEMLDADKLRVFVSYARIDASDFAEYLVVALKHAGFSAYLDQHDIARGEDWEARLDALISSSDTVIFVITPASVKSERCLWEVQKALERGKRLVPVQWISVNEGDVPQAIKRLNYTFFKSGEPFAGHLVELAETLKQDLAWLRKQTLLTEEAERWHASSRNDDLLLRGVRLMEARQWASERKSTAPAIAPLLVAFLGASDEAEELRSNAERQRLEEMALAQSQRGQALAA